MSTTLNETSGWSEVDEGKMIMVRETKDEKIKYVDT